eukprot:TRINITY_DN98_c0_g2_i1.p1 TRINITY_DN98_c0_g2~~TRINITY_DN98_c0_g2_i1.p1  ORF type:complete len:209 (-),score=117.14 TRINITY_DN98_c0_g2_i1:95-688(-)
MTANLFYFNVKARAHLVVALLEVGNIPYRWERNFDWQTLKPTTTFGQLPFIEIDGIEIAQSNAIARYIGKKANLEGEGKDYAISEMLIEEQNDILTILARANKSDDIAGELKKALEVEIPKHFGFLEKLLAHGGEFFGSKLTTGDVAIWSIVNIVIDVDPAALDKFNKLKAFYGRIEALAPIQKYLQFAPPTFIKRT